MKNGDLKLFLCLLVAISIVTSCSKPKKITVDNLTAYQEYVTGVTSGLIKRSDAIVITFANAVVDESKKGSTLSKAVLSFSPSIEGEAIWSSTSSIIFTPKKSLDWNTTYEATLKLSSICKVPKELSVMKFTFETPVRQFVVHQTGLQMATTSAGDYEIKGAVETSDEFDPAEIEKALSAQQPGSSLTIVWEHHPKEFRHDYTIMGIKRCDENSEVTLSWNGGRIDANESKGSETIVIPSLKDFLVSSSQVVNSPDQYVEVIFSDPLDPNADFRGLIMIDGKSVSTLKVEYNILKIYPSEQLTGQHTLLLLGGIESAKGYKLGNRVAQSLNFGGVKPQVRLLGTGVIVPQSEGLYFPFEAVNLSAVDVRITKIFTNNIHSFLQNNDYRGNYQLEQVGRIVKRAKVDLTNKGAKDLSNWNAFNLDLSKLISVEPGAIYNVEIGFRKSYSLYTCKSTDTEDDKYISIEDEDKYPSQSYQSVFYENYYNWQKQDEPCEQSYYSPDKFVDRNILASNFGIIAKTDQNQKTYIYITNLLTAKPEPGVQVGIYDYQNQLLSQVSTDGSGMVAVQTEREPFLLVAKKDRNVGYLKIDNSTAISNSNFDVAGCRVEKGIKGFLYGERNVWRPGDTVYVHFILEDKQNNLPMGHPLTFEIYNPKGQFVKKIVRMRNENFIYPFYFNTKTDDPTGNWQVVLKAGTVEFSRSIQVETIKPNRLKVELTFKDDMLTAQKPSEGKLASKWLMGTPAKNLKAKVDVSFSPYAPTFKNFKEYDFSTPYTCYYGNDITLFNGNLDEDGNARVNFKFAPNKETGGFLMAHFATKVFENGGDFSINHFTKPFSPYNNYVGLKIDWSYKNWNKLDSDEDHTIGVATVDANGNPVSVAGVQVKLFELDYRWWYDSNEENLASYAGQTYHKPVFSTIVNTLNGKGEFTINKNEDWWGRHLLLVTSPDGHTCGQVIYFGWSWGRGQQKGGAQVLALVTEKEKFNVGEKVTVSFPASEGARALITFENGTGILGQEWLDNLQNYTHYTFTAKPEMAPNVYVSIMLIQPHGQTANDLPIRLYGVTPVMIEDPGTRLEPILTMPDEVRPLHEFTVKVREAKKRPMDYTIAIVDEGLLDLTNFKTPDPWSSFYAREALGVRTYDLYNYVMGSFGSRLESMFAVGGSDALNDPSKKKAERFKPVVKVLGPFRLKASEEATHKVTLPQYVGSVRAMVVAADNGKYGNTEKTVPVREPLMVLATLPRVLSPGETVDLPVTVFAMNEKIKSVKVNIETNENLTLAGKKDTTITFDKIGEKDITFKVKSADKVGIAKVKVQVSSGGEKGFHEIELDIRHPNPPTFESQFKLLKSGEKWEQQLAAIGMEGTNNAKVEVSSMPSLNLGNRLEYLISYPHGCVEQTTSAAFPQIYLPKLLDLSENQQNKIKNNVDRAIEKLQRFQISDGGFSYWPGSGYSSSWASSYVVWFLSEAEKAGYLVPSNMKKNGIGYLRKISSTYTTSSREYSDYDQAFRLFVLSSAGDPQLSAMNRLRKDGKLNNQGKWMLAASYAMAGMKEVAYQLIDVRNVEPDDPYLECYGSPLRDRSLMLQTLVALNEMEQASKLAIKVSQDISTSEWYSTQSTACALVGLSSFGQKSGAGKQIDFVATINGKPEHIAGKSLIHTADISFDKAGRGNFAIENKGTGTLFVTVTNSGIKPGIDDRTIEKGLQMSVKYYDQKWNELNIERLRQGQDFIAYVTVFNKTVTNISDIALCQMFPAGWEIINSRLLDLPDNRKESPFDYRDYRDDRVYTYFDLPGKTTKSFIIRLNASYCGEFLLPAVTCAAMYDNSYYNQKPGQKVKVAKE